MSSHQLLRSRTAAAASLLGLAAVAVAAPLTPAHATGLFIQPGDLVVATFGNLIDKPLDKVDPRTGQRDRIANGLPDRGIHVTSDREGNQYVATLDSRIVRIDRFSGAQRVVVGAGALLQIRDLAMGSDGKLLVAGSTTTGPALMTFDPSTNTLAVVVQNALFGSIIGGIALDANENILVADSGNRQIVRVDATTHQVSRLTSFAAGDVLGAIAVADDGSIVVRANSTGTAPTALLVRVDPQTGLKSILVKGGPHLSESTGMARGEDGRLYLTERRLADGNRSEVLVASAPFTTLALLNAAGDGDSRDVTVAAGKQVPPIPDPVANPDRFTLEQPIDQFNSPSSVLANDRNLTGTAMKAEKISDVQHGFTSFFSDGTFFYFPETGFAGTDTLTYRVRAGNRLSSPTTVTFRVLPPQAPIARDDFLRTPFGKEAVRSPKLGPLFNDTDPQGDALQGATVVTPAAHGSASFDPDSTLHYRPNPGFSGDDTFAYTVSDGTHTSNRATVTVTVE